MCLYLTCRGAADYPYLQHCSPGFADLADVTLVSGDARLPAHSQYLAYHSHFIQRLIQDTGPFSWKDPLVIDTALRGHSRAAIDMLLIAVYQQQGKVNISSAQGAWQMCKLADHLDCPGVLQQCEEYISSSSGAALADISTEAVLQWMVAAHELGWDALKQQCAESIAEYYHTLEEDLQLVQLPTELCMLIMKEMVKQHNSFEERLERKVEAKLIKRNGHALKCMNAWDGGWCHTYRFFCEKIDCVGHDFTAKSVGSNCQTVKIWGNYHCDADPMSQTEIPANSLTINSLLPHELKTVLQNGHFQLELSSSHPGQVKTAI